MWCRKLSVFDDKNHSQYHFKGISVRAAKFSTTKWHLFQQAVQRSLLFYFIYQQHCNYQTKKSIL